MSVNLIWELLAYLIFFISSLLMVRWGYMRLRLMVCLEKHLIDELKSSPKPASTYRKQIEELAECGVVLGPLKRHFRAYIKGKLAESNGGGDDFQVVRDYSKLQKEYNDKGLGDIPDEEEITAPQRSQSAE